MKMFDDISVRGKLLLSAVCRSRSQSAITQCYHYHHPAVTRLRLRRLCGGAAAAGAHLGRCLCVWTPVLLQLVADQSRGSMGPASNQDNHQ